MFEGEVSEEASSWSEIPDSETNVYVRRWLRHFASLRKTSLEACDPRLSAVMPPSRIVTLKPERRDLLINECWLQSRGAGSLGPDAFDGLIGELEEAALWAQQHSIARTSFIRLGFRAPTDSALGREDNFRVDSGSEALELLLDSQRVFEDLCLAQECAYTPALLVRPWIDIPPGCELRAFIRGNRLVALSQRHLEAPWPQLQRHRAEWEQAVQLRCAELAPAWPLEDLVVDFACLQGTPFILDVHPWLPWSSPALFTWEELDAQTVHAFRCLS